MPNGKIDKEKCRDTFHPWRIYEPSDVKVITKEQLEAEGYESTYVTAYNHILESGWYREERRWVSPDGTYRFFSIYDAYRCQRMLEEIEK